jgi:hypothetical protein
MVNVILSHEVKDFSNWKKGFDEGEPLRTKVGVKVNGVYTSFDNSNLITLNLEFPSVEAVNGFMANPELKAAMEQAGVISVPDVKILKKVE